MSMHGDLGLNGRPSDQGVHPLIRSRWSVKTLSGEMVDEQDLMALFEAAHWAPSSFNGQPWRFIYSKNGDEYWATLFSFLTEHNQMWVKNASVLAVAVSSKFNLEKGIPAKTHSFDTGAAWMNMALEAVSRGIVANALGGFDRERATKELGVPDTFHVECMIAIGKPAGKKKLLEEMKRRGAPSQRKPLENFLMKGKFTI